MLKRGLVIGLLAANVLMAGCGQKAEEGTKDGSGDVQTEQNVNTDAPPSEEESTPSAAESDSSTQEAEQQEPEEKKPEKKSSKKKKSTK